MLNLWPLFYIDYDSTSNRCCEIGNQKAIAYQKNQTASSKLSSQDLCSFEISKDLVDLQDLKELEPVCLSLVKLCCIKELNKQVCRYSKSIVKKRLDNTVYSLNKETKSSTAKLSKLNDLDNNYYQQCLPNPNDLRSELSLDAESRLFTKLALYTGNQEIYSECCVACKLGLFSALNDFKCIADKNMKPSKLFEETFYDCCIKLKRSLNLASGKKVDIASLEVLIYPKLQGLLNFNSSLIQTSDSKNGLSNNEIVTSQPLIELESLNVNKKLEQQSKMMDNIRTQIIISDNNLPKDFKDLRNTNPATIPNCPTGMRLDDKNSNICIDIDECEENSHNCKADEKCSNLNSGFMCIKLEDNDQSKIAQQPHIQPQKENEKIHQPPQQPKPFSNQLPNRFPNLRQPNFNQINSYNSINPFMHSNQLTNHYPRTQFNQPQQVLPRFRQPSSNSAFSKRKLIDRCKIGNHNCDLTQTCRKAGDNFLCINNQELEEYDRLHPYSDDYQPITTTQLPFFDNNKLRKAELLDQFLPDELIYNPKKQCEPGFQFNSITNECEDIDECASGTHNCTINYRCDNKIGSFICIREYSCGTGYTYNMDKKLCEDIDECKLNSHHCKKPYKCVNYDGTFRCELNKCKENHRSVNNKCVQVVCSPGFIYNSLSDKCVDIDECLLGISEQDLNFLLFNKNEQNNLNNLEEIDKLERLSNGRYRACKRNQKCINNLGGFSCQDAEEKEELIEKAKILIDKPRCLPGYELSKLDNRTCQKISECHVLNSDTNYSTLKNLDMNRTKFCNYKCVKLNDEFSCQCPSGFNSRFDGLKCIDIDECKLNPNICESNTGEKSFCQNLRGSFKCIDIKCPEGYVKDIKNIL